MTLISGGTSFVSGETKERQGWKIRLKKPRLGLENVKTSNVQTVGF